MKTERKQKITAVAAHRQPDLAVVLENIHDAHNVGAVLRTCDSVGVQSVFLLNTEDIPLKNMVLGKRTSSGTRKWLDIRLFRDREACFAHLRKHYQFIFATHLAADAVSLYDLDLTRSMALVFGNEHSGISDETLRLCDGNFAIPQFGFAQSLNISVSCAVTLYEALRQRLRAGMYGPNTKLTDAQKQQLVDKFTEIHESRYKGRTPRQQ